MRRAIAIVGGLSLLCTVGLLGDERSTPQTLGKAERAVAAALTAARGSADDDAVRSALRNGLLLEELQVSNKVFGYLVQTARWVDWRPVTDILLEYEGRDPQRLRVSRWLDDIDLQWSA